MLTQNVYIIEKNVPLPVNNRTNRNKGPFTIAIESLLVGESFIAESRLTSVGYAVAKKAGFKLSVRKINDKLSRFYRVG